MHAAVVTAFDAPPRYREFPVPEPATDDETLVQVVAAGLHPRVLSQADGSHYTSTDELPLVPGIDGVGRGADGRLRYFVLPDTAMGAMAEQTVIDARRSIVLPDDTDAVAVAAGMNPATASWIALRRRIAFQAGQSVLVLGATGSAGRMALQVARHLGAERIVAAGRGIDRHPDLRRLGATDTVEIGEGAFMGRLGQASRDVDVVLDFLWGAPTAAAMVEVVTDRADRGRPLAWIEIGSVAGPTAEIPSAALRAARVQIVGSGQGSVSTRDILAELPGLAEEISSGTFTVEARPVPLSHVEQAWADASRSSQRIVLMPQPA